MGEIYTSVIEYGVQSYPNPGMKHDDKGWGGWRFMRIEYHDTDEPYAFMEYHVWMPPGIGSAELEDFMEGICSESQRTLVPYTILRALRLLEVVGILLMGGLLALLLFAPV